MNSIYSLMPELEQEFYKACISSGQRLDQFLPEDRERIITFVVSKLRKFYPKSYLHKNKFNEIEELTITWISGLCELSPKSIFAGLHECLRGNTEYKDKPPPTVMVFHDICKKAQFPEPQQEVNQFEQKPEDLARSEKILMLSYLALKDDMGNNLEEVRKALTRLPKRVLETIKTNNLSLENLSPEDQKLYDDLHRKYHHYKDQIKQHGHVLHILEGSKPTVYTMTTLKETEKTMTFQYNKTKEKKPEECNEFKLNAPFIRIKDGG